VLQVSYGDTDPQKAAVVNTLMGVYLENNLLANRVETTAARQFIASQLPKTRSYCGSSRVGSLAVQRGEQSCRPRRRSKSAVAIIGDLQRQLTSAQTGLADAKAVCSAQEQLEEIYSRQELLLPLASLLPCRSYSKKSNR